MADRKPQTDGPPERRWSGLRRPTAGLTQLLSFLALVEEGDIERVAVRRGLGRSTVSGHLRQVAGDLGDGLFRRLQTGLLPSEAGRAAYRRLRPLMLEISDVFGHLRDGGARRPERLLVTLADGMPGSDLARALDQALEQVPALRHVTDILHAADEAGPGCRPGSDPGPGLGGADLVISHADAAGAQTLPDRWLLIGLPGEPGWEPAAWPLDRLRGRLLAVPAGVAGLAEAVDRLAGAVGTVTRRLERDWLGVLSDLSDRSGGDALVLLPASLANRTLLAAHARCALLEPGAADPVLSLSPGRRGRLDAATLQHIRAALADGLAAPGPVDRLFCTDGLTLRHCVSFCVLHEERNIRRAAERLCVVQPALTVQLQRIEEKLGDALFERSSRGVRPNQRADRLYEMLNPPLAQLMRASQGLGRPERRITVPKLRVGIMPSVDDESTTAVSVARALDRWARAAPGQGVEVTEAFSATLVRWLRQGRVDLILVDQPFDDPELLFETVATDSLAVIVDNASNLLPPGPVNLDRIRDLPLVLPSQRHGLRSLLVAQFREHGWRLQPRIEIDSMAAALSLVKTTRYATILPVGAVHLSQVRRQIGVHEIRSPRLMRRICVGRRRREPNGAVARALVDEICLAFATLGAAYAGELGRPPPPPLPPPATRIF